MLFVMKTSHVKHPTDPGISLRWFLQLHFMEVSDSAQENFRQLPITRPLILKFIISTNCLTF